MHPCGTQGRDKRRPSPFEGFHGSREKDHSTELRIISERVVVEGVILTCRTPLLRRWEITRREKEERESADPRGSEMVDGTRRRYRPVNKWERDDTEPARRGMAGGKGPSQGGRRSNEPTSHGVVPTRAPSRFFLLLSRCLPREYLLVSLFFSLFRA